jgi:hypothetical protein
MGSDKVLDERAEIWGLKPDDETGATAGVTTSRNGEVDRIEIRDRIKELRRVRANDLLPNKLAASWRSPSACPSSAVSRSRICGCFARARDAGREAHAR